MKRAIAMKCNQEQWDAIKWKLGNYTINSITSFSEFDYLTNFIDNKINNINKITFKSDFKKASEVRETWNEQIFLEACGIEKERIFKGSELQYWNEKLSNWMNCQRLEYRLKPDHSKEIAELERQIEILKNK